MDQPVDHIDVQVYADRNYLLGHIRIPADLVPRFSELLEQARLKNPVYDAGLLARWIVKAGYRVVQREVSHGHVELKPGGS